jgi:hypothetical protein
MDNNIINLVSIFFIGPLLIYIGLNKNNTHDYYYNILGLFALMIPYIISQGRENDNLYKSMWFVFFIYFIYVAICKNITPDFVYNILVYFGFYIIILHCYYLYQTYLHQNLIY